MADTDVLVDHLRGERRLDPRANRIAVSVVSHCELFAGTDDAGLLRRFLSPMIALPVDREIAELAGVTRRRAGISTPDALIAATALVHDLDLVTRNRRHFDRVSGLRIRSPA